MQREQMRHVARAACDVTGVTRVVILGSPAVLGTYDDDELHAPDGWEGRTRELRTASTSR